MKEAQEILDYRRVERALEYIDANSQGQPTLDDIAKEVGVSPYHFQRTFTRWCGISPKRFLQAVTVERAREVLIESKPTFDAAVSSGLSGTGRLYDLFMTLEGAPPGAYRTGGIGLTIRYGVVPSPFGHCFLAMTENGICRLEFSDDRSTRTGIDHVRVDWPNARYVESIRDVKGVVDTIFRKREGEVRIIASGTNFQIQVWRSLLSIPRGALTTYGDIGKVIGRPRAGRAVGTAVGRNPVAYLIPCHRVIQRLGTLGGYRWGLNRKRIILGSEISV
jgi:AraC family transcriptional regulator, regulatory protein of adaptative response / methylated-DNA-[protein]-cysteine methyltransferase